MSEDRADAGKCLRALTAEALRYAFPGRDLLPASLGLQATANAFVMLGLLPEAQAEAILTDHRAALEPARVTSYSINGAEVGPRETAEIVATVADSLMAVGALPVTSAWLRDAAQPGEPGWRAPLVSRWGNQGRGGFRPAGHLGLAARLPLEQGGSPGNEGSGSFWFWPPVDTARTSMRVTVSTLREAAWADIPLPR